MAPAQAFVTSYAPRLRRYGNSFVTPVIQTPTVAPTSRTTKRGTTIINYADDAYDDDDFDEGEGPRRPTGLRSLRREDIEKRETASEKLGKEIHYPVNVPGIYRDWLIRRSVKPTTDQQVHLQAQLPLTLIPIRIDVDVPAHQPETAFPIPPRAAELGINLSLPVFRRPEPAPPYKIRDLFLWNLHEALVTPDEFARKLVQDLDLPNQVALSLEISKQIRTQLEEYAGIALHPLFHNQSKSMAQNGHGANKHSTTSGALQPTIGDQSRGTTPKTFLTQPASRAISLTPGAPSRAPTPVSPQHLQSLPSGTSVTAHAALLPPAPEQQETLPAVSPETPDYLNPDDTYRCIITLSIALSSHLYTDKFEWSLLHPIGFAEAFAKQTCADMGLSGEWVLAITHGIYEAVLKLKKEACEGGMLMSGGGIWGQGEIDNQAVRAEEGAGLRYDADDFGAEWGPKLEMLSKDEIEKREGDRERQLRRLRRETARFSSTAGMAPSAREQEAQMRGSYFDLPGFTAGGGDSETPNLGRGERSKKKRRFRSLSPVARNLGTPNNEGVNGVGTGWGGGNQLTEYERPSWRCKWCLVWGSAVWAVRDGPPPYGPRSLCNNCGLLYERDKKLPVWSKDLHKHAVPVGR